MRRRLPLIVDFIQPKPSAYCSRSPRVRIMEEFPSGLPFESSTRTEPRHSGVYLGTKTHELLHPCSDDATIRQIGRSVELVYTWQGDEGTPTTSHVRCGLLRATQQYHCAEVHGRSNETARSRHHAGISPCRMHRWRPFETRECLAKSIRLTMVGDSLIGEISRM